MRKLFKQLVVKINNILNYVVDYRKKRERAMLGILLGDGNDRNRRWDLEGGGKIDLVNVNCCYVSF